MSIKGLSLSLGIFWSIAVFWCILMELVGTGSTPFNFVDQFYLGWLSPTIGGLTLGTVIAFIDGAVMGEQFLYCCIINLQEVNR